VKTFFRIIIVCITLLLFYCTAPIPTSIANATTETSATTDWIFPNTVAYGRDYINPLNVLERDGNLATASSGSGRLKNTDFDPVFLPDDAEITKIEMRFHLAGVRTTAKFKHNFGQCLDHERQRKFYKDFVPASMTMVV